MERNNRKVANIAKQVALAALGERLCDARTDAGMTQQKGEGARRKWRSRLRGGGC